jgi:hypothetical protein
LRQNRRVGSLIQASLEPKTVFFKLIELYWLNKDFIAQVVEERGLQQPQVGFDGQEI